MTFEATIVKLQKQHFLQLALIRLKYNLNSLYIYLVNFFVTEIEKNLNKNICMLDFTQG